MRKCRVLQKMEKYTGSILNSNLKYIVIFSLNVPSKPYQVVTSWNIRTVYRAEGDLQSNFTAKQWTVKLLWWALTDLCLLQAKRAIGTWWKMMNKLRAIQHVQDLTSCVTMEKLPYIPTGRLGFFWTGVIMISQRLECSHQKTWFLNIVIVTVLSILCFSWVFMLYLCSCVPPQSAFHSFYSSHLFSLCRVICCVFLFLPFILNKTSSTDLPAFGSNSFPSRRDSNWRNICIFSPVVSSVFIYFPIHSI